jgi:hypothetical protein
MADTQKPQHPTKRIIVNICAVVGLIGGIVAMNVCGLTGAIPGALFGGLGGGLGALIGAGIAAVVVREA